MPISQARMIALITAAQDYEQALEALISSIQLNTRRALHNQLTLEELCRDLQSEQAVLLLVEPMKSVAVIAREAHHFKITKRRNQREAERQRRKREGLGIQPKPYVPFQPNSQINSSPFITSQTNSEIDQIILEQQLHGIGQRPAQVAAPVKPQPPVIDLAHDPDDPENWMQGGVGIASEDAGEE